MAMDLEWFDPNGVAEAAVAALVPPAQARGVTIELSLDPRAGDLFWDQARFQQVIWNLATNGVRAMPEGGRLRLAAGYDDATHSVLMTVQDEGIGIPPEEIETLFQPFHGSFAKGSGLGLAIVHRIVTDYRGVIQVSSRRGSGTLVSVRLPAHAEVTT